MTQRESDVADAYLYYRQKRGYSRVGAIYRVQQEFIMSRAVVIDILSRTIVGW